MKLLTTISSRGEGYTANIFLDEDDLVSNKPAIWFFGDADIDADGSPGVTTPGRTNYDPDGDSNTSLHFEGKPINSEEVPGIVLPPELIKLSPEIVLGCFASVEYNGKHEPAVVFDVGPHNKLGEITPELARRLGINPSPRTGGTDAQEVHYRFWPGVAANIDGKQFELKPFGS